MMPVIIDANRASDFVNRLSGHAPIIMQYIMDNMIKIIVGGKLLEELSRTGFRTILVELKRGGKVISVDRSAIDPEVRGNWCSLCISNDAHVVALARLSGARLLYTDDNLLIIDFKNKNIVRPRGKIIKPTTGPRIADKLLMRFGS